MKHFLFLTTNNLATNPRLFKELQTAINLEFNATVVQFKLGNWSDPKSEEMNNRLVDLCCCNSSNQQFLKFYNNQVINLDATSENKINWFKWGLLEKIAQKLYPFLKHNIKINALASSRRALQIYKAALVLKEKPDLICAHNLGALYPAWRLSQKWHIPFVFDVEDYHPGEFIRFDAKNEQPRRELLMKKLLPHAANITSASPLIGNFSLKLIGGHPNHQVIFNSFPQEEFILKTEARSLKSDQQPCDDITNNSQTSCQQLTANSSLRLVWFSQKISFGRGLEQLFEALQLLTINHSPLTITLIGDLDPQFNQQIIQPFRDKLSRLTSHVSLFIKPPLSQSNLHAELANHDIGLALEFNTADLNRQLCLTNKITAYAQSGLYILATDTPAQKQFIKNHPDSGLISKQAPGDIKAMLEKIRLNIAGIRSTRQKRFEKGKELAWEIEADKLKNIWKRI